MLAADRSAVETDLQAQAVQIKNIEMNNIDRYLQAIGTQAALICGFAASESWAMEKWNTQHCPWWLIICYYMTNITSLLCEMYCVMNATLVSVLGPTFALNGPKGSMHEAVKSMKEERMNILNAFYAGAISFGACQVFTCWIISPIETAVPVTIVIVFGFYFIWTAMMRIKGKFRYNEIYAGNDDGRGTVVENRERKSSFFGRLSGMSTGEPASPKSRPMKAQVFLNQKSSSGYPAGMLEIETTPHGHNLSLSPGEDQL